MRWRYRNLLDIKINSVYTNKRAGSGTQELHFFLKQKFINLNIFV